MNILLADNQSRVRSALRLLLEQQAEAYNVKEADTLQGILASIKNQCPDIILLDWGLLGITPEKTVAELQASCPGLFIIAMDSNPQTRLVALKAGANEFVSKNDPPECLLAAIKSFRGNANSSSGNIDVFKKW